MNDKITKETIMLKGLIGVIRDWVTSNVVYINDPYELRERLNEHLDKLEKELCDNDG